MMIYTSTLLLFIAVEATKVAELLMCINGITCFDTLKF